MDKELYKFDIKKDVNKSVVIVIYIIVIVTLFMSAIFISHSNIVGASIFIALSIILIAMSSYKKISIYSPISNSITISKIYFNKPFFLNTINLNSNSQLKIFDENVRSGNSPAQNIGNKAESSINTRNSFLTLTISSSDGKELELFSDHRPEKQEELLKDAKRISRILDIKLTETEARKYK